MNSVIRRALAIQIMYRKHGAIWKFRGRPRAIGSKELFEILFTEKCPISSKIPNKTEN